MFSIFTYSEYRKLGLKKIRDFQTSVFSIFTIGEYRKHGCLKTSDFLKSQFSIFTRQMFEIRDFENLGFLKSKFSIFTIGEYRKHGFIKAVGEKNPRYPRHPRFRSGPFRWLLSPLLNYLDLKFSPSPRAPAYNLVRTIL